MNTLYIDNEALDAPWVINRYHVDQEGCEVNVTATPAPVEGNGTILCPPDDTGLEQVMDPDGVCCPEETLNNGYCIGGGKSVPSFFLLQ